MGGCGRVTRNPDQTIGSQMNSFLGSKRAHLVVTLLTLQNKCYLFIYLLRVICYLNQCIQHITKSKCNQYKFFIEV